MIDFSRFNSIYVPTDYFDSETKCRKAVFESRWDKDDVICPFCGRHHCYVRNDGLFRCHNCKKNFSVLVGTIFENTKISIRKWFIAMYLISTHKKGISSVQLATDIDATRRQHGTSSTRSGPFSSRMKMLSLKVLWSVMKCILVERRQTSMNQGR